jgi:hypothetical protein
MRRAAETVEVLAVGWIERQRLEELERETHHFRHL